MKKLITAMVLLYPCICNAMGETESMRCNNGIVSPENTKSEVIQKCGQPMSKSANLNKRLKIGYKTYTATEKWLYDFGAQEFNYIVLFNGDKVSILYSTNDYGTYRP